MIPLHRKKRSKTVATIKFFVTLNVIKMGLFSFCFFIIGWVMSGHNFLPRIESFSLLYEPSAGLWCECPFCWKWHYGCVIQRLGAISARCVYASSFLFMVLYFPMNCSSISNDEAIPLLRFHFFRFLCI